MNIFSSLDPQLLVGLAVAAAFSLLVSTFFAFQRPSFAVVLALLGTCIYYRWAFAGFLLVIVMAYAILHLLSRQAVVRTRWKWTCAAMAGLIVIFTVGRVYQWERSLAVGGSAPLVLYSMDMWLVLRLITLFWETGSNAVPLPSFSRYLLWNCLPLTLGGPVLRYSQFPKNIAPDRLAWKSSGWWGDAAAGAAKLAIGPALTALQQFTESQWPQKHLLTAGLATLVTGPLSFYLTIAGYLQLMETLGRLCGIPLPVSFNRPIGRENISLFWANWNMTATAVFRDYLFYNRWGLSGYNVYFNTMVLFVLVGLWHSANAYWLLWGFLHGVFFCAFLLWRKFNNRLGFLPFRGTAVSRVAARTLTYVAVCACWYLPSKILQKLPAF